MIDLQLRKSSHMIKPTAAFQVSAGFLGVWLPAGVRGFRPVLARGWHGQLLTRPCTKHRIGVNFVLTAPRVRLPENHISDRFYQTFQRRTSASATFRFAATLSLPLSTRVMSNVGDLDYRFTVQLECRWSIRHCNFQVIHVGTAAAHLDAGGAIIYYNSP
jgi:hypothetical protein